jgi:hypothetical protein
MTTLEVSFVTLQDWQRCLQLTDGQVKRFIRSVLKLPYVPDGSATSGLRLQLCLLDWILHVTGVLNDAQAGDALEHFQEELGWLGEALDSCPRAEWPAILFSVADGRWASVSNGKHFFDVKECEPLRELPIPAVTHVMCDLGALYSRTERRLQLEQERRRKRQEPDDGDEQG